MSPKTTLGVGKLLVQASAEGCVGKEFSAKRGEETTSGSVGGELELAAGVYEVILNSNFGDPPARQGIVISKDQTTVEDFSQDLGVLQLEGYPEVCAPSFIISPGEARGSSGTELCGPTGTYTVTLATYRKSCPDFCFTWGGCCNDYFHALFPNKVEFGVEVMAGEKIIVGPADWPQQLGKFGFEPAYLPRDVQVEDIQNGIQFDGNLNDNLASGYWMLVGEYRLILLEQPYTGTEYEFEIKVGETTILQAPSSP